MTEINLDTPGAKEAPPRRGRKRDHGRDVPILEAAIDLLVETGYDGMTMDMVAERANAGKATVYRRWSSKAKLVVDAVAHLKGDDLDLDRLPDTGSLRGDLLWLFRTKSPGVSERKMKAMAGLAAMLSQNPDLANSLGGDVVEPWIVVNHRLIRRAIDRGEIRSDADVETASRVIPSMATHRTLIERTPFDKDFLIAVIDQILLPALRKDAV